MEALAAVGVAAAAVQFLDFGSRLLAKSWEACRTRSGSVVAATKLSRVAADLHGLAVDVRDASVRFSAECHGNAADGHFIRLCAECEGIVADFEFMFERLRKTGKAPHDKLLAGLGMNGIRKVFWEEADNPLKVKGEGDLKMVSAMEGRIQDARNQAVTAAVFSLWEDSKRKARQDKEFGAKLDSLITGLERIEAAIRNQHEGPTPAVSHPQRDAFAPQYGGLVVSILNGLSSPAVQVRHELAEVLWDRKWSADDGGNLPPPTSELPALSNSVIQKSILKSIDFTDMEIRSEGILDSFENTCEWVFGTPAQHEGRALWASFPEWLETPSDRPYWITGKPGSGKSTTMKHILQSSRLDKHLRVWSGGLPVLITSYYAWNSGTDLQKSREGLLRTILYQALASNPSHVREVVPRRWAWFSSLRLPTHAPPWEEWELEESFHRLLRLSQQDMRLAIFVDGLDEFEVAPVAVVELINNITNTAKHIKVCVASRPWTEFNDAFRHSPTMEMHLLTHLDIAVFVNSKLSANQGFAELKAIYPAEASSIAESLTIKANGVFLWVALVTRSLLLALSEGESLSSLQSILDQLPSDIHLLYNAIWERINPRNLRDASAMVQIVMASRGSLPWFVMWLADEWRSGSLSNSAAVNQDAGPSALRSLKRRLDTRTRGIVEISSYKPERCHVGFSHRTAHDWARRPEVWERICTASPDDFDAPLCLLQAEVRSLACHRWVQIRGHGSAWNTVCRLLWYASQVEDRPCNVTPLVQALDGLDTEMARIFKSGWNAWFQPHQVTADPTRHPHWSTSQPSVMHGARYGRQLINSFVGLSAQFSILPYLRAKTQSQKALLRDKGSRSSLGLLENAVLGVMYYMPKADAKIPPVPVDQRLRTVKYLVENGIKGAECHTRDGRRVPINTLLQSSGNLGWGDDGKTDLQDYADEVCVLLTQVGTRNKLESLIRRFRMSS
ncbi:hypothetical protein OQA88_2984 [Cercophora sp. LCS_1]